MILCNVALLVFLQSDLEYYKEQYRQLKSENETLKNRVDELGDEMESAKVCCFWLIIWDDVIKYCVI